MKLTQEQKNELLKKGYTALPQLNFNLTNYTDEEVGNNTYNEDSIISKNFLSSFNFEDLKLDLARLAEKSLDTKVDQDDTYSITRQLKSYDNLESYRGHFDSHVFTIVTPVKIPKTNSSESGQLIVFPKIRNNPLNELINFYEKLKYKVLYGNAKGYKRLMGKAKFVEFDFKDKNSIIFLGRQCFHGNRSFSEAPDGERITILTHFFDPNKRGIGALLRKLRNR